ncbi:MAG: hypothetical protein H6R07_2725 [Proteobacteria bacterium]|nr:hypothetical protein [Pseudomonadota bacterium]
MIKKTLVGIIFLCCGFASNAATIYLPDPRPIGSDIYQISKDNVAALSNLKESDTTYKLVLEKSESSNNDYFMCRGWFPLHANGNMPFDNYIVNAMKSEMEAAGFYSADSSKTIKLRLEKIDYENMINARWKLQLKIEFDDANQLLVDDEYAFSGHFIATNACERTATAFMPAVQSLLNKLYSSTEFISALGKQ